MAGLKRPLKDKCNCVTTRPQQPAVPHLRFALFLLLNAKKASLSVDGQNQWKLTTALVVSPELTTRGSFESQDCDPPKNDPKRPP